MKSEYFLGLKGKQVLHDIVAFDVEGCGGGGFVCGAIVSGATVNFFTDKEDMFQTILEYGLRGYWIFSHNLEYDLPVIADNHLAEFDLLFTDSGMLWGTYRKKDTKIHFYDSMNLFPRWSVAGLGKMIGLDKLTVNQSILDRLSTGKHYLDFDLFEQKEVERYCIRDAEIVYKSLKMLQDTVFALGGSLRPTIAGTSMDLYRRKFHKWPWKVVHENTNELARAAFYGGRVEPFQLGKIEHTSMYDTTSLYPYVQDNLRFPHPNSLELLTMPQINGDWWKWEGVMQARITIPQCHIPALPYRYFGKLFFPYGTMVGTWTIHEVRHALENGAILSDVAWVLGTRKTFNPFREFVEQLFEVRSSMLANGDSQANLVKLLLNSLYGRFGLDPSKGLFRSVPLTENTNFDQLKGWRTFPLGEHLVAYGQVESMQYPSYINTLFSSQIASAARIHLYYGLIEQGDKAVYCDTDSIITTGSVQTGEGLGSWRSEFTDATTEIIAPKEYAIYQKDKPDKFIVKGIPHYKSEEYIKNHMVHFLRAISIREGMQRGLESSTWVEVLHTHEYTYPKRQSLPEISSLVGSHCQTAPWSVEELEYAAEPGKHRKFPALPLWKPQYYPQDQVSEPLTEPGHPQG